MVRYDKRFWEKEGMNKNKFIAVIVACVIVVVVVVAAAIHMGPKEDPEVTFADPKLEATVRETIDIPEGPIYRSNVEMLTALVAYGMNITDLTGLEHCASMTQLSLFENQISDISPLGNLTKLRALHLWYNQISDIWPLANLTNLEYLTLAGNRISDVSALEGLTKLTWLYLGSNQISDISPLVSNLGLGEGDQVGLRDNPLSVESVNEYIPKLVARGVTVEY
jgi:internalin A